MSIDRCVGKFRIRLEFKSFFPPDEPGEFDSLDLIGEFPFWWFPNALLFVSVEAGATQEI